MSHPADAPKNRADDGRGRGAGDDPSVLRKDPETEVRHRLTVESESLLDQAAGFARGGDYLGARARARFAEHRFEAGAAALPAGDAFVAATRAGLELRLGHYDELVREWQLEVDTRHTTFVARERRIIGAAPSPPLLPPPAKR